MDKESRNFQKFQADIKLVEKLASVFDSKKSWQSKVENAEAILTGHVVDRHECDILENCPPLEFENAFTLVIEVLTAIQHSAHSSSELDPICFFREPFFNWFNNFFVDAIRSKIRVFGSIRKRNAVPLLDDPLSFVSEHIVEQREQGKLLRAKEIESFICAEIKKAGVVLADSRDSRLIEKKLCRRRKSGYEVTMLMWDKSPLVVPNCKGVNLDREIEGFMPKGDVLVLDFTAGVFKQFILWGAGRPQDCFTIENISRQRDVVKKVQVFF